MQKIHQYSAISGIIISIILIFCFFQYQSSDTSDIILVHIQWADNIQSHAINPGGVLSRTPPGSGYGFLISHQHIITAGHVIGHHQKKYHVTHLWNTLSATRVYLDEQNDIAILALDTPIYDTIDIHQAHDIHLWDDVTSIWKWKKHGVITDIHNNIITHTIPFTPWESGSVLLNKKNEILGINIASSQNESIWYSVIPDITSLVKSLR